MPLSLSKGAPDRAHLRHAHLSRAKKNLHEQLLDIFEKTPPERRDRGVAGMAVGGDATKSGRVICRPLSYAARSSAARSKISPSQWRKPKCPTPSGDARTKAPNRDNRRASREGRAHRSPRQRTAPNAFQAANRPPEAKADTPSPDQSSGNCSSAQARRKARINGAIPPRRTTSAASKQRSFRYVRHAASRYPACSFQARATLVPPGALPRPDPGRRQSAPCRQTRSFPEGCR